MDDTFTETEFGFRWNGMEITRLYSHTDGYTVIRVAGAGSGDHVDVYVSPKGHAVRCHPSAGVRRG